MILIKQCSKCKEVKNTSEFTINRNNKDGLQGWCKNCKNEAVKQYRLNHLEERRKYDVNYYRENKDKVKKRKKKRYQERRYHALQFVSGLDTPKCIICGCDFVPMLEINHINREGKKDRRKFGKSDTFYGNIIKGMRKTNDLDVRCKFHNDLYYYENKFGSSLQFKIVWGDN